MYERTDRKWRRRPRADNGSIIATDGRQGYENESKARRMADRVVGGTYKDAEKHRAPLPD